MKYTYLSTEEVLENDSAFVAHLKEQCTVEGETIEDYLPYYESGGDLWICDPDKVRVGTIVLNFAICDNFVIMDFDPLEFPRHAELVESFAESSFNYIGATIESPEDAVRFDYDISGNTWDSFESADEAIAYRGGSGYSYGIYCVSKI